MIIRNSNSRRAPLSAREPRASFSCDARGNSDHAIGGHRLIAPEAKHESLDNLTDEFRTVFIGVARHGLGTIVRPFLFKSFLHAGGNSRG